MLLIILIDFPLDYFESQTQFRFFLRLHPYHKKNKIKSKYYKRMNVKSVFLLDLVFALSLRSLKNNGTTVLKCSAIFWLWVTPRLFLALCSGITSGGDWDTIWGLGVQNHKGRTIRCIDCSGLMVNFLTVSTHIYYPETIKIYWASLCNMYCSGAFNSFAIT